MNIAAYCRVSTDKEDQINSLETQKEFFDQFCHRHNHNLVHIYADEGISGTKVKNRKEFQRLMSDAEKGNFDAVAVKDISRLARNTVDFLTSIRKLKAMNINTLFLTANMSVMGDSEFILTIFGAMAQEESANTSKRVKFGKKMNREKGKVPNYVFGYDKVKGDFYNLHINQQEAEAVRKIFALYTKEGYGTAKIAEILNNQKIKTKRNCQWTQTAVARILQNEIYTGKLISGKEEVTDFLTGTRKTTQDTEWTVLDRPEFRIIEERLFAEAQEIIKLRSHNFTTKRQRHSNKHQFSTLIKCSHCGHSFKRIAPANPDKSARWVCCTRNLKGRRHCENAAVLYEDILMAELQQFMDGIAFNKIKLMKYLIRKLEEKSYTEPDQEDLQKQLNHLDQKRRKYIDLFEDDIITKEELKAEHIRFQAEKNKIQAQLEKLQKNYGQKETGQSRQAQIINILDQINLSRDLSNSQYKSFIDRISVDSGGHIDVMLKPVSEVSFFPNTYIHT